MKKRILVSWIGRNDLAEMGREHGGEEEALVKVATGWSDLVSNSMTKPLVYSEQFEEIHLLSTFGEEVNRRFKEWLGKPATIHRAAIDQWDFPGVFAGADKMLGEIVELYRSENSELCLHLSSGSIPMVAALLLLGCTRYPAKFYQTIQGKSSQTVIPFELDLFVREQFIKADESWADLPFRSPAEVPGFEHIVGTSDALLKAVEQARRAAIRNVPVLLLGESGVGKELFARAIHNASGRKGKFVAVNCAAIPGELVEAELFGAAKGAGTGVAERPGYFREANLGTLFMDEIGEMSLEGQSKLLRAVESAGKGESPTRLQIGRVGKPGQDDNKIDVRIVTATNRDLLAGDANNRFRNDLYHRLSTFRIQIPSLRERRGDIPLLAKRLVEEINNEFCMTEPAFEPRRLSAAAVRRLKQHDWPGNVRELKAVLTRALIMSTDPELGRADIDREVLHPNAQRGFNAFSRMREPDFKLDERVHLIEKAFIEDALNETGGNRHKAAELLRINYQTLYKRIQRLKILRAGTE